MSEKTEDATPKKKRKSREDGQVAKSAEFTGVAVMVGAVAVVLVMAPFIAQRLAGFILRSIELATRPELGHSHIGPFMMEGLTTLAILLAPLLGVTFVIAAFVSYVQIGALFTIKPLIPDFKRLDAIKGMKNIVSKAKLVELVKNVSKLTLMGSIGYVVVRDGLEPLVMTPRLELFGAVILFGSIALRLCLVMVAGLIVFGIVDLIWQRYKHARDLRMSKDEVKREYKESEGDPMLKGKRKQLHQELINDVGMSKIKDADAVIVNPTHVAVALRYREKEMHAPKIIAAGRGEIAQKIKGLARRYDIPIVHNVALARALVELDLEREIPEEFYDAVAEILRFVYSLREEKTP